MVTMVARQILMISLTFGLCFIIGCQVTSTTTQVPLSKFYFTYDFYSDPPGAHVYNKDGQYFGQTDENKPVSIIVSKEGRTRAAGWGTLTFKKRGYKETEYHYTWESTYVSKEEARMNRKKEVVVLDLE